MINAMLARLNGQVYKTLKQVHTQKAQRARYASAMNTYTAAHRARHQLLAWHAATKRAEEHLDALEAENALEGIAGSSKAAVDSASTKSMLNKSGSAAATNLPFVNGVSQRREFSTTSSLMRSKAQAVIAGKGRSRVNSDETMHTDTTFCTGSASTHTTNGAATPSMAWTAGRGYSSKAEKTPEQKRLDDEEHRLAEGLVKGDHLMNQDEGMNPNEDKEGVKIHPTTSHHHNNRSKRTGKNDGGSMATAGPGSPKPKAARAYGTKAPQAKSDKEGVDDKGHDRFLDRNVVQPEHYEYTRSGTDGEVGDDPEAYSREHTKPEEEIGEEEMKKGNNPLEFSPANPEISKPPKESEMNGPAHSVKEKKSGPGKSKKGHAIGTKLGDKVEGEPGL